MAREVRSYAVSVPAGTSSSSPQVTDLDMPARTVRSIRWRVPPGPAGVMGWALGSAGHRVIPVGDGQWIVADNEWDKWSPDGVIDSGAWQLQAYNTGVYDHTVYLTFELDPPPGAGPGSDVTLLDIADLVG